MSDEDLVEKLRSWAEVSSHENNYSTLTLERIALLNGECMLEDVRAAADEIDKLRKRVKVLETVISNELYDGYCGDEANQMIVDEINERTWP